MAILDRFLKKDEAPAKKPAAKKAVAKKTVAKSEKSDKPAVTSKVDPQALRLLTKPHVSEKAARLADAGTYVFQVPMNAEKVSIRKAVESLYGVNVEAVRIIRTSGKPVRRGKRVTFRHDVKKALVTLKKGQTLSLYEGV
ncbi:50S ribosomal protein L23 [Candidatus Uhrbacteria bacterium]|nr:50S ribosomal protein L23 [Candidatus Uhrbacteria bacterium]